MVPVQDNIEHKTLTPTILHEVAPQANSYPGSGFVQVMPQSTILTYTPLSEIINKLKYFITSYIANIKYILTLVYEDEEGIEYRRL